MLAENAIQGAMDRYAQSRKEEGDGRYKGTGKKDWKAEG